MGHFHKAMENKRQQSIKSLQFSLYIKMQLITLLLLEVVHCLIAQLKVLAYFQNYKSSSKGYDDTVMLMASLIKEGIEKHELKEEIDIRSLASFLASSMEGAIMASRVSNDNIHHHYFIEQIKHHLFSYSR